MTELDADLRRVLKDVREGILVADHQGRILFANSALAAMSGYSAAELIALRVEDLVPEHRRETHLAQRAQYHLAKSPPRSMGTALDIQLRSRAGSEFPADIALSPIRLADGGDVVIAAVRLGTVAVRHRRATGPAIRLERELHERSLQTLFALSLNLQVIAAQLTDPALRARVDVAVVEVEDVVRELRNYLFGLRPGILDDLAVESDGDA